MDPCAKERESPTADRPFQDSGAKSTAFETAIVIAPLPKLSLDLTAPLPTHVHGVRLRCGAEGVRGKGGEE
uniref:Uncharacterized protein n=1 Tax=Oryza sativa subsp. japonica TaxID=39947 RepID=Q84Q40_ORYSJ|nr:hypothetical protein [Oryza sativa Japonica Group]